MVSLKEILLKEISVLLKDGVILPTKLKNQILENMPTWNELQLMEMIHVLRSAFSRKLLQKSKTWSESQLNKVKQKLQLDLEEALRKIQSIKMKFLSEAQTKKGKSQLKKFEI